MMRLDGRHVVVVGGSSGIGRSIAEACLEHGSTVTIGSTNAERLAATAESLGGDVRTAQIDVTEEESVCSFFERAGHVDHLVSTAGDWGGPRSHALPSLDLTEAKSMLDVRFWGALALAKHATRHLATDGSLTLTNGMIAVNPREGSVVSTAVAGAIEHAVRALAIEMSPVRVNVVCPGFVRTGGWNALPEETRESLTRRLERTHLIRRPAEPAEVVQAYLYLMLGGYTTGQVVRVEGGSSLGG